MTKRLQLASLWACVAFHCFAQNTITQSPGLGQSSNEEPSPVWAYGHLAFITESGLSANYALGYPGGSPFAFGAPPDLSKPQELIPQPSADALGLAIVDINNFQLESAQQRIFEGLRFYLKTPEIAGYQNLRKLLLSKPFEEVFKVSTLGKTQLQNLTDLAGVWGLALLQEGSNTLAVHLLSQAIALREQKIGLSESDLWLFNNLAVAIGKTGNYAQARSVFDRIVQSFEKPTQLGALAVFYNNMAMMTPSDFLDESLKMMSKAIGIVSRAKPAQTALLLDLKINLSALLLQTGALAAEGFSGLNTQITPDLGQNERFMMYLQYQSARLSAMSGRTEGFAQILPIVRKAFADSGLDILRLHSLITEAGFWSSQGEKAKALATLNLARTLLGEKFQPLHPLSIEILAQIANLSPLPAALTEYDNYFSALRGFMERHFFFLGEAQQMAFLRKRHRELSQIIANYEKNPTGFARIAPLLFDAIARVQGIHVQPLSSQRYVQFNNPDIRAKEAFLAWLDAGEQFVGAISLPKASYPALVAEMMDVQMDELRNQAERLAPPFSMFKQLVSVGIEQVKQKMQPGEAVLIAYRYRRADDTSYCLLLLPKEVAAPQIVFLAKNPDRESAPDAQKLFGPLLPKLAGKSRIYFLPTGIYWKVNPFELKGSKSNFGAEANFLVVSGLDGIGTLPSPHPWNRSLALTKGLAETGVLEELLKGLGGSVQNLSGMNATEMAFLQWADSATAVVINAPIALGAAGNTLPLLNCGVVLGDSRTAPFPLDPADGTLTPAEIMFQNLAGCKAVVINGEIEFDRFDPESFADLARAFTRTGAEYVLLPSRNTSLAVRQAFVSFFLTSLKSKSAPAAYLDALRAVPGSGFLLVR